MKALGRSIPDEAAEGRTRRGTIGRLHEPVSRVRCWAQFAVRALSAYPRQLDVMVPVLLFWLGVLAFHLKKPSTRFAEDEIAEEISLTDLNGMGIKEAV